MKSYLDVLKQTIRNIESGIETESDWRHADTLLYTAYCLLEILPEDVIKDEEYHVIDDAFYNIRKRIEEKINEFDQEDSEV